MSYSFTKTDRLDATVTRAKTDHHVKYIEDDEVIL